MPSHDIDDSEDRPSEDVIDILTLPIELHDALEDAADLREQSLLGLIEQILQTAIEPQEPSCKRMLLTCTMCKTTMLHRFTRAELRTGGIWQHRWGRTRCFHMRSYGSIRVVGPRIKQLRSVPPTERQQIHFNVGNFVGRGAGITFSPCFASSA